MVNNQSYFSCFASYPHNCLLINNFNLIYYLGSTDHSITVWRYDNATFTKMVNIKKHTGPVTNVAAVVVDNRLAIVNTSNDNTVRRYSVDVDNTENIEDEACINLGTGNV